MYRLYQSYKFVLVFMLAGILFSCSEDGTPVDSGSSIERDTFERINQYRNNKGLATLEWSEEIAEVCRKHSQNMANGSVEFGHDGFDIRVNEIADFLLVSSASENVAFNVGFSNPAEVAVQGWIDSQGHRENIEGNYNISGIGVVETSEGRFYFTQIFVLTN